MVATPPLIVEATREFLRRHAPFNRMDDVAFAFLIPRLKLAYFAQGATILAPQGGVVGDLHVIQHGRVGSHPDNVQADPDPTLGPGELFPVGALSAGATTTKIFHAVEDTFCYLLARDDFIELRRTSPAFELYCAHAVTETLKQSLATLHAQYSQRAADEQALTCTLGELVRREPVAIAATAPIRDALERMAEAKVRTVIALDAGGVPIGMFTLVDLLRRVVLPGRSLSTPVREVMSSPIVTLPGGATAYEAMHVMAERAVRQVVVVDGGRAIGAVNERDLFTLQRVSMRQVIEGLHSATSLTDLKRAADDIRRLTGNLLAQGVGAEPLTRTIVSLNDALSRRVIELVLELRQLADVRWCWLALGSEGRGEQTFATDQDNALVFIASDTAVAEAERSKLIGFAAEVNAALDALGFPLCPGKVMASNPELCLTVDEWKAKFLDWMREPTPQALLAANILFDFRSLFGDATLAEALRTWLSGYTQESRIFLRLMVQNALEVEPPLGLIRAFATDEGPANKGTVDLKTRGTRLFVDAARVFALALGIAETGTATRLRLAGKRLQVEDRHVAATIEAFHFLQLLRLRQQDLPGDRGHTNRIDPGELNEVEQRMLKEAYRQAKQLQRRLRLFYQL